MKRTINKRKPNAILTGDWHLREDQPVCRTDNFPETQWKVVDFIANLQRKYKCPVYHSGDLFHNWKPSPALLSKAIEHIPKDFWTIYGNHDLPQWNLKLDYKCGIYTLIKAGVVNLLKGTHWGYKPEEGSLFIPNFNKTILVWHVMTWLKESPFPGCEDPQARRLLKKYPEYDLILTGHNHKPFTATLNGRLLVNPGCIIRQEADQIDFRPRVYLWYADTNTVEKVYLPDTENVISREHLDGKKKRDNRIEAFISKLNNNFKGGVTFEGNLEKLIQKSKVKQPVKDIIQKALDS